ncbi:MAG: tellurium resistance protein TerC [Planctomycetota bacterium]
MRIGLLLLIMSMIEKVSEPLFGFAIGEQQVAALESTTGTDAASADAPATDPEPTEAESGPHGGEKREWKEGYQERGKYLIAGEFTLHSLITLFGGAFILYTAVKEVMHLLAVEDHSHGAGDKKKSTGMVIFWIVLMNLIFSFDSILSAMALTKDFWTMATAIVISGAAMVYLADHVSDFLKKNRMYEVLGLFILFIVGVMLIGEGGHLAHLQLFTYHVEPMAKSTFYFTLAILVVIDVVQSKYRKKLLAQREAELQAAA